jgi:hypothetical protein
MTLQAYKFLAAGARGPFTDHPWVAPDAEGEAVWGVVDLPLRRCDNGWHACTVEHLPYWLGAELWEVELDGEILTEGCGLIAERARLRRQVPGWPDPVVARFVAACAWRLRDLAVAELALVGAGPWVQRLTACTDLESLASSASAGQDQVADDEAATMLGYAEDAATYAIAGDPAAVAYIAAHAADHRRTDPGEALTGDVTPFQLERSWQARWLAAELHLPTDGP